MPNPPPWRKQALCAGFDPAVDDDIWFPELGDDSWIQALGVCAKCPVRDACRADVLKVEWERGDRVAGDVHGIVGGLTPAQRIDMYRKRRQGVADWDAFEGHPIKECEGCGGLFAGIGRRRFCKPECRDAWDLAQLGARMLEQVEKNEERPRYRRKIATHCRKGHPFTAMRGDGRKRCLPCERERGRRKRERARARKAEGNG